MGSVVIAGMDIDTGNAFSAKHVAVARVVLERQLQFEAISTQLCDCASFEAGHLRVVPSIAHDEQIPPQLVVGEPGKRLRHHPKGATGKEDDLERRVEEPQQMSYVLDQRILTASIEERVPVVAVPLDEVLPSGGV